MKLLAKIMLGCFSFDEKHPKRGIKTATCSSYQATLDENEPLPKAGAFFIVLNSANDPVCICETTDIRVGSFQSADAEFAFDEGENDRTLESWRKEHRRFFGLPAPENSPAAEPFLLVFERFRLVWPVGEMTR